MSDKDQLMAMGFTEKQVNRALRKTKNSGLQPALDFIVEHGEEPESDQEVEEEVLDVAVSSLRCDVCQKLFRNSGQAEMHAVKTQHMEFSETTEKIKPLTEEEKKEKLAALQQRLVARKEAKRLQELEEEKQRETVRRTSAAEMQVIREKLKEEQIKKDAEERRMLKEQDRLAKERVKQQLEQDKLERKRLAEEKKLQQQGIQPPTAKTTTVPAPVNKNYEEARIQIRLPSGPPLTNVFKASDTLQDVYNFCQQHHPGDFKLMQSFPRKLLTDKNATLQDLQLCPSSALILQ